MNPNKTKFIFLLIFSFFLNFLPSSADSNFTSPVLNPTNLSFNGPIYAIVVDEMTGIVYVGGKFTKIGEIERNHLAAIGTDGTLLDWNPNADNSVNALAIKDSTIYAGGVFSKIGESERNGLAAIGTNGTLQNWNPNVGPVFALAIKDSTIYAAGVFTNVGGKEGRHSLVAIGTDGTLQDWDPNINISLGFGASYPEIHALTVSGSTLYVGGEFDSVDDKPRSNFASFSIPGQ